MKKIITVLSLNCFFISGCGGRAANPVMSQQYGDKDKGCDALKAEMTGIQSEISRLNPDTDKTGKNVALGGSWCILPCPLVLHRFKPR